MLTKIISIFQINLFLLNYKFINCLKLQKKYLKFYKFFEKKKS